MNITGAVQRWRTLLLLTATREACAFHHWTWAWDGVCLKPVKVTRENLRMKPTKTRAELRDGNNVLRALLKLLDQNRVSPSPGSLIT